MVGKGENAGNQYFLLSPQCFPHFPTQISIFRSFISSSENAFNLDKSKNLLFGKDLNGICIHQSFLRMVLVKYPKFFLI